MRIDHIEIQNFRGIESISLDLDPQLNVFIGDNGSGKTALLEALTIAAGSFFIGMQSATSKGFRYNDMRLLHSKERATPVVVKAKGEVAGTKVEWSREKNSERGQITTRNTRELTAISREMDSVVRILPEHQVILPVIAYFTTGRLYQEVQQRRKSIGKPREAGSRFRGYKQALDAKSNFKDFLRWFRSIEMSQIQRSEIHIGLSMIKQAIIKTLPGCLNVFYDLSEDTPYTLLLKMESEFGEPREVPFELLSDGMRSFFALIADIAYRCVILNPHLKERALVETNGIVFIDELDLHLHPSWQKIALNSLKETFPKVQFMITTHSPFLIQEAKTDQLFILENCQIKTRSGANDQSIEDIAEGFQGVDMPQWSEKRKEMFSIAKEYYQAVKEEKVTDELKERFQESMKPFSSNTAYHAILEQERILKEYQKNNPSS